MPLGCYLLQAHRRLDVLRDANVIGGVSGITVAQVVGYLWPTIVDDENKFELLRRNVSVRERRVLANTLSFQTFKFTVANPTSHWRIDLSNRAQRAMFLRLVEVNAQEAYEGKTQSGRKDTSQKGNWQNFRNERLNSLTLNETTVDAAFIDALPKEGFLEFDYVSTARPPPEPVADPEPDPVLELEQHSLTGGSGTPAAPGSGVVSLSGDLHQPTDTDPFFEPEPDPFGPSFVDISDAQFADLLGALGMASHRKLTSPSDVVYALLELLLSAAKYYFTVQQVGER
jgi:hypothetical protein